MSRVQIIAAHILLSIVLIVIGLIGFIVATSTTRDGTEPRALDLIARLIAEPRLLIQPDETT